jgi:hypothetical protein
MLERARQLARTPDVQGLFAMVQQVETRMAKEPDNPELTSLSTELNVLLNEARALRLKLDAEALNKASR